MHYFFTSGGKCEPRVNIRGVWDINFVNDWYFVCINCVLGPPMLRDNVLLKVRENSGRIPVNISEGLAAFPEPTSQWNKDGQPLSGSRPVLTYDSVTFDNVMRSDAGNYTVVVTNYVLSSTTEQVGSDSGSFSLDVLCKLQLVVAIFCIW